MCEEFHVTTKGRKPTGAECRQTFSKNFENFEKDSKSFWFWLWGAAPQTRRSLAGGAKPPQTSPLNGRSSHLIEAAKQGRLDQMNFFSAPLTIRAPLTTRVPLTTVRRPEANCTSAACRMPSFNFLQPLGIRWEMK